MPSTNEISVPDYARLPLEVSVILTRGPAVSPETSMLGRRVARQSEGG